MGPGKIELYSSQLWIIMKFYLALWSIAIFVVFNRHTCEGGWGEVVI